MFVSRRPLISRLAVAAGIAAASCTVVLGLAPGTASASSRIAPGERRCFGAIGSPGQVAIINLTPVEASGRGDGKLLPSGVLPSGPVANVNFYKDSVDPNVAFTRIGDDGLVCFYNSNDSSVDLVADQLGTITTNEFTYAAGGYQPGGQPYRIFDTRISDIKIRPNERKCFSVPGTQGWGAIVNLTPVLADGGGDGQLLKNAPGIEPPLGANVNFRPGSVDPNVAVAEVGSDPNQSICYVNSYHTSVHLIADSFGSIPPATFVMANAANGTMVRVLDTRFDSNGKIGPGQRRCFSVSGNPGDAAVVNLTPVHADANGDGLLVSSDVTTRPNSANVNFSRNSVDPNLAVARVGQDGRVCFLNSVHTSVDLVADQMAVIASASYVAANADGAPTRILDTRFGPYGTKCDPSYPTVCIPPPPPDLNCPDITYRNFLVVGADPHGFDRDRDGIGCASG